MQEEKIKVCAYCRVSTDSKDQANSYENQKSYFEREIGKNEHYELYKIYADSGLSGTNMNRKEFLQMCYDAGLDIEHRRNKVLFFSENNRKPKFKKIFVSNTSRFARNVLAMDVIRELRNKGVSIQFLDTGKNTESIDDESWINMFLIFAQQESVEKSKRVRFGHKESAKQGKIFVNGQIYGYDYFPETRELKIIEDEAKVIKEIFELYASGKGIRQIVNHLESNGVVTRKGKPFVKTTIGRILQNEKYAGILVRNKYTTGDIFNKNSYAKVRDKNEWEVFRNEVPAIISEDMFRKVEKIRESRTNHIRGIHRGVSEYAGKIVCGKCGSSYTKNTHTKKDQKYHYPFYNCSTKKTKGVSVCDNPNIKLEEIEECIDKLERKSLYVYQIINKNQKIDTLNELKTDLESRIDEDKSEQVILKKEELATVISKKEKLLDLYLDGSFDKNILEERTEKIELEENKIIEEINTLSKTNDTILSEINEIEQTIKELQELEVKKEYSRDEVLESVKIMEVRYRDDGAMDLLFTFTVDDLINRIVTKYDTNMIEMEGYAMSIRKSEKFLKWREEFYANLTDEDIERMEREEEESIKSGELVHIDDLIR